MEPAISRPTIIVHRLDPSALNPTFTESRVTRIEPPTRALTFLNKKKKKKKKNRKKGKKKRKKEGEKATRRRARSFRESNWSSVRLQTVATGMKPAGPIGLIPGLKKESTVLSGFSRFPRYLEDRSDV